MTDEPAISYKLLEAGTAVLAAGGEEIGTVARVLDNPREHIFDGIVIDTPGGERFADAPEVARITASVVTLSLDAGEAADLPEPDQGAPEFRADPSAGRIGRMLGGGWKRRR